MAINFANVKEWAIPEGNCVRVRDSLSRIIWQKDTYTDMDYVSCTDAYTGIIVPVSIPSGSTYEIMCDSKVTSHLSGSGRFYSMITGGINSANSKRYGWGIAWNGIYYINTTTYGPYVSEAVYWDGWPSDYTSNRFSIHNASSNVIADNQETEIFLRNTNRTYHNITSNTTKTITTNTECNWNSASAVNGWWGFGIFATGQNTWDTDSRSRFIGNIYGGYIKVDGEYIYNFKPVVRDRDGVYGLYDTVNDVFYPSCTSNPFTHEVIIATALSLSQTSVGLGKTKSVGRTFTPSNTTNKALTWTSNNTSIATVNSSGVVSGLALGTTTVTATTTDGSNITATGSVRVYKPVTDLSLSKYNVTLGLNDSDTVTAYITPSDAYYNSAGFRIESATSPTPITISDNNNVCTITSGSNTGSARIKVTADDQTVYLNVTVSSIIVNATGISLNTNAITLEGGDTRTLTATLTPSDATESVNWRSSNTSVATVSQSGVVTAVGAGTCTITCTTSKTGYSDTCTVTVPTHRFTINATPNTASIAIQGFSGGTGSYYVDVIKGTELNWNVSNPEYHTAQGSYTMGASDYTLNISLERGSVDVTGITLNKSSATIERGATLQLSAVITPSDATVQTVTWSSSDTSTATVNSSGLVTGVGSGTCTITCSANDNSGVTATCNVTVYSFSLSDSTLPTMTTFGQTATIFGTLSPGTMSINGKWVSSDTDVVTVNNNTTHALSGREYVTITAVGTGTATVYFSSSSLTTMYNMPVCGVQVDVPVTPPVINQKFVTLDNLTNDTVYYGKNSNTTIGLAAGSNTSVTINQDETLYISMCHCLPCGNGCPIVVNSQSTDGSLLTVRDDTYTLTYANAINEDIIEIEDNL